MSDQGTVPATGTPSLTAELRGTLLLFAFVAAVVATVMIVIGVLNAVGPS